MDRPRLLPRQAEVVEQPQHAVLAVGDAEAVLGAAPDRPPTSVLGARRATQILGPPRAHAVALGVGAAQDQGTQARQLPLVQPSRPSALGAVAQTFDPRGVEPDDPVPKRLPIHPGTMRRLLPAHAVEHIGQRHQPAGHPAVALLPGEPAQLLGRDVGPERNRCAHRLTSLHHHAAS